MMRAMLTDRLHLRLHTEIRKEPVFNFKVAKSGIKIHEVDPTVPPAKEGYVNAAMSDRGGRMIGNKATMGGMATALTIFLQRLVIDQTGLKGYYDSNVRWSAPAAPDGQVSWGIGHRRPRAAHFEPEEPVRIATHEKHRPGRLLGGGPRRTADKQLS